MVPTTTTVWDRYLIHLNQADRQKQIDLIEKICKLNDLPRGGTVAMAIAQHHYTHLEARAHIHINGKLIYIRDPGKCVREDLCLRDHHDYPNLFSSKNK